MATPDYDPPTESPPQPGTVNDLPSGSSLPAGPDRPDNFSNPPDSLFTGGSSSSGSSSGSSSQPPANTTQPYEIQPWTPSTYTPANYDAGKAPTLDMGPLYKPKDIPIPTVKDTQLKDPGYKPPPLPTMPDVDKTMTPAPEKTLEPMSNLIPGGDTTSINEDWEAIAAKAPGVTAEQTVAGQLERLFQEGSPLLEYARNIGLQYANSRGLINSDVAAEAGAMALYNQAVPIATADAQIFARRAEQEAAFWQNAGLQAQAANFQSRLQAQAHVEQMRAMALQGDINARLQLQQFGYNWDLNEQQNIHRMELAAFEGKVQAKLALQQLGLDAERLRIDWAYRVQANDQELRNALVLAKFEDDQAVQRITQQHMNNIREMEMQGYQQRLTDYQNNVAAMQRQQAADYAAFQRQQAADRAAWERQQDQNRANWESQQSEQTWRSGENQADRDAQLARDQAMREWEDANREDTQAWNSGENQAQRDWEAEQQHSRDVNAWMSQYVSAVDRLGVNLTNEIMTIMNNGNMTASQQQYAARQAWDRYVRSFQNTTATYRANSLWDPNYRIPDMLDFGDVYSGSSAGTSGTSGYTAGGAGSQPSTPANPSGVTGGSSQGYLADQPTSFVNQWEASGYDLQKSGNYWIAVSPSGRRVVWHERTKQWVDPNHHQYRNDFPGLNMPGYTPPSGGSGGSSDGWYNEFGEYQPYRDNSEGSAYAIAQPNYVAPTYQAPTYQAPAAAKPSAADSYTYYQPSASLYNDSYLKNPLYGDNLLSSTFNIR